MENKKRIELLVLTYLFELCIEINFAFCDMRGGGMRVVISLFEEKF